MRFLQVLSRFTVFTSLFIVSHTATGQSPGNDSLQRRLEEAVHKIRDLEVRRLPATGDIDTVSISHLRVFLDADMFHDESQRSRGNFP
ncbi:MAG: hypothetical protein IID46_13030 [Planctomycetes bacterium]|nr:hypothetical protein [Planctomycetota bacterium]